MSFFDTKKPEIEVANLFSNRYNNKHKADYKVRKNPIENSSIDCFMYIESFQEEIGLQMVVYDKGSFSACIESMRTGKGVDIYPTFENCIINSIQEKSEKYDNITKKDLILLVWSSHCPYDFNENYLKEKTANICKESCFREIYCVRLPDKDNGDIIKLR